MGFKGCYSEKRKKRGKIIVLYVDIKKKRILVNCIIIIGWKSLVDIIWFREFWVYFFYFRKVLIVSIF